MSSIKNIIGNIGTDISNLTSAINKRYFQSKQIYLGTINPGKYDSPSTLITSKGTELINKYTGDNSYPFLYCNTTTGVLYVYDSSHKDSNTSPWIEVGGKEITVGNGLTINDSGNIKLDTSLVPIMVDGKIPTSFLPSYAVNDVFVYDTKDSLSLSDVAIWLNVQIDPIPEVGDIVIVNTDTKIKGTYVINKNNPGGYSESDLSLMVQPANTYVSYGSGDKLGNSDASQARENINAQVKLTSGIGITLDDSGNISVNTSEVVINDATTEVKGIIKVGSGLNVTNGEVSIPDAGLSVKGLVQYGDWKFNDDSKVGLDADGNVCITSGGTDVLKVGSDKVTLATNPTSPSNDELVPYGYIASNFIQNTWSGYQDKVNVFSQINTFNNKVVLGGTSELVFISPEDNSVQVTIDFEDASRLIEVNHEEEVKSISSGTTNVNLVLDKGCNNYEVTLSGKVDIQFDTGALSFTGKLFNFTLIIKIGTDEWTGTIPGLLGNAVPTLNTDSINFFYITYYSGKLILNNVIQVPA